MKRVLVAPLDWGLGHATRCIPVIQELLSRNCLVTIAGSGDSLALMKIEFPNLTFFSLPGYSPVYPSSGSMAWKIGIQLPKFLSVIRKEHRRIEQFISENKIDLIISDHRYGCWSASIPSVFITHQYTILPPKGYEWLTGFVNRVHERMIKKFSICWIPDSPGKNSLAGLLAFSGKSIESNRIKYVGNLSRFNRPCEQPIKYDVACVFSGPEPQRSIIERIVADQVYNSGLKYVVVRGLPSTSHMVDSEQNSVNFLSSAELQSVIEQSTYVIARSGYSTVMDLSKLGKKAIFIPTPGQPEQEYLADRLMKKKIAYSMAQHDFNFKTALEESLAYTGFEPTLDTSKLLKEALDQILSSDERSPLF